jgi:type I restriction enzyme, R subunit
VQTLSRLNRAYPGKDTTYVLDFVNSSEEVLTAFRTYYETAELEANTDPNLIFDLRAKLDGAGHYDDFEVDRVVQVEMDPRSKQSDLIAALEPVADRLLKQFKSAQAALVEADARGNEKAATAAKDAMAALDLFKADLGAFQRLYAFLSQVFDYGNTAIEKRFIFYRRLLPLLDFGRERPGVDLSQVKLTHHSLKSQGRLDLPYGDGETPKLAGVVEVGSGGLYEKEKALLEEIIARVNDLFEGELTDDDQLVYVNNVIKGKLLESEELVVQASNNTKAQFANSPTLTAEIMNAVMDALTAHNTMSRQALDSQRVRDGLKDVLLGPGQLYEALRERGAAPANTNGHPRTP